MKSIMANTEFKTEVARMTALEAREAEARQRTAELAEQLEAAAHGDGDRRHDLTAELLANPQAELPVGLNLDAVRDQYREAVAEREVVVAAVRQQRDRVASLRTRLTEAAIRELDGERVKRSMDYLAALVAARDAHRAVVALRDELEAAGFQATMVQIPHQAVRSLDVLCAELLRDPAIVGGDRARVQAIHDAATGAVGHERAGAGTAMSATEVARRRDDMKATAYSNLGR